MVVALLVLAEVLRPLLRCSTIVSSGTDSDEWQE
jgi:hypothetical protein